jgi:hypothetical protein
LVDDLVANVWAPLVLLSDVDSGLRIGSRVSASNRSGYILGSTALNKCQSVKVPIS